MQKGYTKKDSTMIVHDFIQTIEETMASGEDVTFYGFGTFSVRNYKGRECVVPSTGEVCTVEPYKAPHFTPGKRLRREVKEGRVRE
jgi:nucleoid DNA-binding protein